MGMQGKSLQRVEGTKVLCSQITELKGEIHTGGVLSVVLCLLHKERGRAGVEPNTVVYP